MMRVVGSICAAPLLAQIAFAQVLDSHARLSSAFGYNLAVRSDGRVVTWGLNMEGGGARTPVEGGAAFVLDAPSDVVSIYAARGHKLETNTSLSVRRSGDVVGWGRNGEAAALGRDMRTLRGEATVIEQPVPVPGFARTREVRGCGAKVTFALREDSTLWMTPGSSMSINGAFAPTEIAGGGFSRLGPSQSGSTASSSSAICEMPVIGRDSRLRIVNVYAQGSGARVQYTATLSPELPGIPPLVDAACQAFGNASMRWCIGLDESGAVLSWGNNSHGQLGNGTREGSTIAAKVVGLPTIAAIASTQQTAFALGADGRVYSWGNRTALGREAKGRTDTDSPAPIDLSQVKEVSAGYRHACARRGDGTVWCWGTNRNGELGDGTTTERSVPVQVLGVKLQ
jgi:alpha-tubulin suppressor-like RCC1 family protein